MQSQLVFIGLRERLQIDASPVGKEVRVQAQDMFTGFSAGVTLNEDQQRELCRWLAIKLGYYLS